MLCCYVGRSFVMDQDWHQRQLACHCRVCGNRLQKAKSGHICRQYVCSTYTPELKKTFTLDISTDNTHTHPTHMCRQCFNTLQRSRAADCEGRASLHSIVPFKWEAHSESCKVSWKQIFGTLVDKNLLCRYVPTLK